jgi:hypothetical protein
MLKVDSGAFLTDLGTNVVRRVHVPPDWEGTEPTFEEQTGLGVIVATGSMVQFAGVEVAQDEISLLYETESFPEIKSDERLVIGDAEYITREPGTVLPYSGLSTVKLGKLA